MDTITKNTRKTLLATVLVAMLALVAVAGVVTYADDSAASSTSYVSGDVIINSDTGSVNYNITYSAGGSTITIASGADYTGTIQYGTYDSATATYTVEDTLVLTGVSSAVIVIAGSGEMTVYTLNNTAMTASTSGTVQVTAGTMNIGYYNSPTYYYFSGTVEGNTATLAIANATATSDNKGLVITAASGSTDVISGTFTDAAGTYMERASTYGTNQYTYVAPSLTVSGTAYMNNFTIYEVETSNHGLPTAHNSTTNTTTYTPIEVTVADGATVTTDTSGNATVAITSSSSSLTTSVSAIYAIDGSGAVITGTSAGASSSAVVVSFTGLDFTKTYYIVWTDSASSSSYVGTLAYSDTSHGFVFTSVSSNTALTNGSNSPVSGTLYLNSATEIDYNTSDTFKYAVDITTNTVGSGNSGKITFSNDIVSGNTLLVVLSSGVYYGTVTDAIGTSATIALGGYSVTASSQTSTIVVSADTILNVEGTLNVTYTYNNQYSSIVNSGTINVSGKIAYATGTASAPITGGTVNAAYYKTGTSPYAYTYTTLDSAMAASSDITIVGAVTLKNDTTFTGTSATSNKITVAGTLNIGIVKTTTTAAVSVTATVPKTTTLTITGTVDVKCGELVFADTALAENGKITAAVFMKNTSEIYTDLATALGLATSGTTVTVRSNADLENDATVASGVTLDLNNKTLEIKPSVTLTVNGTFKMGAGDVTVDGASSTQTAGTLAINNSTGLVWTSGTFTLSGILTVGSDASVTLTTPIAVAATDSDYPAVLNVNGTLSTSSTIGTGSNYLTINVSGTLKTTNASALALSSAANTMMNITGTYTASHAETVGKMTLTGTFNVTDATTVTDLTASGSAKVVLAAGASVTVTKAVIGTAGSYTNNVSAKLTIASDTGTSVVVYGTAASVSFANETTDVVNTTFYIGNDVYSTDYGYKTTTKDLTLDIPSITGYTFTGWYTATIGGDPINVNNNVVIGAKVALYGITDINTYDLTLTYGQGVLWVVDGTVQSGVVSLDYGTAHTITAVADTGYSGTADVTLTGAALSSGSFTVGTADMTASATGITENPAPSDSGLTFTDYLLVVLVVITAVVAIAVVMKLLRK